MTMTLNQAGEAVANNNDAVSKTGEDYVRIGEMAKKYGVTLRTLRFYEDKGLINPKREGSTRLYSRRDNARLKLILLGRKVGFSLRDVKQIMDLYDPKGANTSSCAWRSKSPKSSCRGCRSSGPSIDEAIKELSSTMSEMRQRLSDRTLSPAGSAS